MDTNIQQRVCIKLCVKNGINGAETIKMLKKVYGKETLAKANIYKWIERFKCGRESVIDDEHPGRPTTSTNELNVDKIKQLIATNRKLTIRELAAETNNSFGSVQRILTKNLDFKRVATTLVPTELNCFQKNERIENAKDMLSATKDDENFIKRLVTGGDMWIYEHEKQSTAELDEPKPKKSKHFLTKKKVILTIFFDYNGVVHHEFLTEDQKANAEYTLGILKRLHEAVETKRSALSKNHSWILHHNDAPAYDSLIVRAYLAENKLINIQQTSYSPDLAPCDYFLFNRLKNTLRGMSFQSEGDIINKTENALNSITKVEFQKCFEDLIKRWHMCVAIDGDYLELDK